MNCKKGISLVELMLATLLTTIVVMGLYTILSSTRNMSVNSGVRSYREAAVRTSVTDILNTAAGVVGQFTPPDEKGVLIGLGDSLPNNTVCFALIPDNNGAAQWWDCYSYVNPNIYRCPRVARITTAGAPRPRGAVACTAATAGAILVGRASATPASTFNTPNRYTISITDTMAGQPNVTVSESISIPGHSS